MEEEEEKQEEEVDRVSFRTPPDSGSEVRGRGRVRVYFFGPIRRQVVRGRWTATVISEAGEAAELGMEEKVEEKVGKEGEGRRMIFDARPRRRPWAVGKGRTVWVAAMRGRGRRRGRGRDGGSRHRRRSGGGRW